MSIKTIDHEVAISLLENNQIISTTDCNSHDVHTLAKPDENTLFGILIVNSDDSIFIDAVELCVETVRVGISMPGQVAIPNTA